MRTMLALRAAPARALLAALLAAPCQGAPAAGLALAEAVRLALAQNPAIQVQQAQIEVAAGQRQQASGQFDWQLAAAVNYDRTVTPLTDGAIAANGAPFLDQTRLISAGYQFGLNKQLRNGVQLGSTVSVLSTDDNTPTALHGQQHLARLDVALTVPLLRGRGAASVAAAEDAASLNEQAEHYLLRDRAAQTVYATLQAYWTYRARVELEQVALSAARRSEALLDSVRKLVAAAERPRADLVLLQADLADKQAAAQAATLARNDARVALGRLLGLEPAAIALLAEPEQALPAAALAGGPLPEQAEALAAGALRQRPDVQALALQLEAAQRLARAAHDELRPQLDLQLGLASAQASEAGARYGFLRDGGRGQSDPSLFARLNFQFPPQNNRAQGQLRERAALAAQLAARALDLRHEVGSSVAQALQTLARTGAQMQNESSALALYEQAVSQEIVKQQNGIATLIDVINVEARYQGARVNQLQLQLAYANAIASLRLASGTLLPGAADRFTLDPAELAGFGPLASPSSSFRPTPP